MCWCIIIIVQLLTSILQDDERDQRMKMACGHVITTVPLKAHDDHEYNFYLVLFLIGMTPIATDIWVDLVKQGDDTTFTAHTMPVHRFPHYIPPRNFYNNPPPNTL